MKVIMTNYTTISVTKKTKQELESCGNKGETWDTLLQKLISKNRGLANE